MFLEQSLSEQMKGCRDSRLRVLISGAGVAGVTLARLLRRGGLRPLLVERGTGHGDAGYMLALAPLVLPAIEDMGVEAGYRERSQVLEHYWLHGHGGRLLRRYRIGQLFGGREGRRDYLGISRGVLLDVLSARGLPVTYGARIDSIAIGKDGVHAGLADGGGRIEAEFDALVIAEGIHSTTRQQVMQPDEVRYFDAGWGGWVAWAAAAPGQEDRAAELWGSDFFLGSYPVRGRAGVILLGDNRDTAGGVRAWVEHVRRKFRRCAPWMGMALTALEAEADGSESPYYWRMRDVRCRRWVEGRSCLLGDASAGFLPTAGIGAAMAIESAGVLARRLVSCDRVRVPAALADYERVQRPRVESAQANSRQLAQIMFRRGSLLAWARDAAALALPLKVALRPILKLMANPPR